MVMPNHYPVSRDGLVGWWCYRNTGSVSPLGIWKDYSGNGNDAVCVANAFVDNLGANLNGDADYLDLGTIMTNNALMLAGSDVTVLVSLRWTGEGDRYQRVIDKSTSSFVGNGWAVYVDQTGLYFGSAGTELVKTTSGIVVPNEWHRYAVTFISGEDSGKIYRDGLAMSTVSQVGTIPNAEAGMCIGSLIHTTGREFNGEIDNMQVYNRACLTGEIQMDSLKNMRA